MRLVVLFDLPTKTKKDKKAYSLFRRALLNEGYYMLQYSIYIRTCKGYSAVEKHKRRLKSYLPTKGHIRLLVLTNKMYENIELLLGEKNTQEKEVSRDKLLLF